MLDESICDLKLINASLSVRRGSSIIHEMDGFGLPFALHGITISLEL